MKTTLRRALGGAFVAAALLATSACSGGIASGNQTGSDAGPIKLAQVIPTSGSSAPTGVYMKNGAQMAVDEINAAGGVLGRQLELDTQDEACDPTSAAAAANKAVSNGDHISIGGYCSGATLPTLPIFNRANIPMLISAANSQELVKQDLKNVFLINGTGAQQSQAALAYFKKTGVKVVAIADDNTSYSKDIATQTKADVEADGSIKVAMNTSVTAGESDYSALVNSVKNSGADMFYWTGYYQEGGLIINQLKAAGFSGKIMVGDGSVDPTIDKISGGKAEGVLATMTPTPATLEGDAAKKWIADYKAKFGSEPGPYSTQSYDAVRLAAEAIKRAGSTDGDKVIAELEKIDGFEMFSGPLKFTPQRTLTDGGFQILIMKNGNFVLEDGLK